MQRFVLALACCLFTGYGVAQTPFIDENFDTGIPATWTVIDGGAGTDTWIGTTNGTSNLDGTSMAFVDSDGAGSGAGLLEEELISPAFDASAATVVLLEFDQFYRDVNSTDTGFVDVFDGTNWVNVAFFNGTLGAFGAPDQQAIDISAFANAAMQVRFRYDDDATWAWWWAVDNVVIYQPLNDDAIVTAVTAPATSGRVGTLSALGAAETVAIEILNNGALPITSADVFYELDGTVIGPETYTGSIASGATDTYTFTATADLSAPADYAFRAWVELTGDQDNSNDTSGISFVRQIPNPLLTVFPVVQDFELATASDYTTPTIGVTGLDQVDYSSFQGFGRLRTEAGAGFSQSGTKALTLDRNPSGGVDSNIVILTYNFSNLDVATDVLLLDFAVQEHGDEVGNFDLVWVRGSETDPFIAMDNWNNITGNTNGQYAAAVGLAMTDSLAANGQNFSNTTQVAFSQEDNFPATSITASDGVTFDDVVIRKLNANDGLVSELITPATSGRELTSIALGAAQVVSVQITNNGALDLTTADMFYSVNGTVVGPETYTGSIPSTGVDTFVFATTADLSAGGTYDIEAWIVLAGDADTSNDTLSADQIAQLPNPLEALPYTFDFEMADSFNVQANTVGLPGLTKVDYENVTGDARIRSMAPFGPSQSGVKALTFDKFPSGGVDAPAYAILTLNLSDRDANTDQVLMDVSFMEHGDEVDTDDRVWIRGSDTDAWIEMLNWSTFNVNGAYVNVVDLPVSDSLLGAGQNFSTSFQVRIGHSDNSDATSLTGLDGVTFDDVVIRQLVTDDAGVTALVSPMNLDCGDSMMVVMAAVTNFGTDTIEAMDVSLLWSDDMGNSGSDTITYSGSIAFNESDTVSFAPINSFAGGVFTFEMATILAGDTTIVNDSLMTSREIRPVPLPMVDADTICVGDSTTLIVSNADTVSTYSWWDAAVGGNLIAEGDSFDTGVLLADTTYYVSALGSGSAMVGPEDINIGSFATYSAFADGLVFDAFQGFTLDSVTVYPGNAGDVVINLLDAGGTVLSSVTVPVTATGNAPERIAVGLSIPVGTDLRLNAVGTTTGNLYRNSNGAVYPYSAPGLVEITGPINNLGGFYYFYYNWAITANFCEGPRVAVPVSVADDATAAFSFSATDLDVSFTNASTGTFASYMWDFGDGVMSMDADPMHTYMMDGEYEVTLIVSNACGSDTLTDSLQVCSALAADFDATDNGLEVSFADSTSGTPTAWIWDFGDGAGTSMMQDPVYTYGADGDYTVLLTTVNLCGDSSTTESSITVCAPMEAGFDFVIGGFDIDFTDTTSGSPTAWAWDFGDGSTSTDESPLHTYAANGDYEVCLVTTNLCKSDTTCMMINLNNVSLNDKFDAWALSISPNPNNGQFTLSMFSADLEEIELSVSDLAGKEIYSQQLTQVIGNYQTQVQLPQIAAGTYLVKAHSRNSGKVSIKRLVIE